jgi:hypothetical protein
VSEDIHAKGGPEVQQDHDAVPQSPTDGTAANAGLQQLRMPMLAVAAFFGVAALVSAGCFLYQAFDRLANGEMYGMTAPEWPAVLGHFVRAVGFSFVFWRLLQCINSVEPKSGGMALIPATPARAFWRTFAVFVWVVAAQALFQVAYTWHRHGSASDAVFRPEFQSGYVRIDPGRIEFRRGYAQSANGLIKMQKHGAAETIYVGPNPEVTGADIAEAKIQITEAFPGSQTVSLTVKLTDAGAKKMEDLTRSHQTKPLAVLIDGKLRAAPLVFSVISRDSMISGVFSLDEAAKMIEEDADR